MKASRSGLYFILNPYLGIIKIGIANDVDDRKRGLEHACGVPLEILRFVEGAQRCEQDLHLAFGESRLRGEWFSPTEELLMLVDGDESVPAFLARKAEQVAQFVETRRIAREAELEAERRERLEATRAERETLARLAEERLQAEQARAEKVERMRKGRAEKAHAAHVAEQAAWLARTPAAILDRVVSAPRQREAEQRRTTIAAQRARNAALVGVHVGEG